MLYIMYIIYFLYLEIYKYLLVLLVYIYNAFVFRYITRGHYNTYI